MTDAVDEYETGRLGYATKRHIAAGIWIALEDAETVEALARLAADIREAVEAKNRSGIIEVLQRLKYDTGPAVDVEPFQLWCKTWIDDCGPTAIRHIPAFKVCGPRLLVSLQ